MKYIFRWITKINLCLIFKKTKQPIILYLWIYGTIKIFYSSLKYWDVFPKKVSYWDLYLPVDLVDQLSKIHLAAALQINIKITEQSE